MEYANQHVQRMSWTGKEITVTVDGLCSDSTFCDCSDSGGCTDCLVIVITVTVNELCDNSIYYENK